MKNRALSLSVFFVLWLLLGRQASHLRLEEDVSKTLPNSEKLKAYREFYNKTPLAANVIIAIGKQENPDADILTGAAENFIENFDSATLALIEKTGFEYGTEEFSAVYDFFYQNLPYFLEAERLDSSLLQLNRQKADALMQKTLHRLMSPDATALKQYLLKDPLGLTGEALKPLNVLRETGNFKLENNHLYTRSGNYILVNLTPRYPVSESKYNGLLLEKLEGFVAKGKKENPELEYHLFGGPVIAAMNARQIREDANIAMVIALVLILALMFWYYRKWKMPVLFLLPAAFGVTFSLALISILFETVSALALGAGTIVFGIILDYCFHFFTHLKHTKSIKETLKDVSGPLLLGCFTTVLAFSSLVMLDSVILRDFGLFAAFSLIGTAFFVLLVLPLVLGFIGGNSLESEKTHWIDRSHENSKAGKSALLIVVVVLTAFFSFFIKEVRFEDDLNKINYFPPELQEAERIISQNDTRLNTLFVVSRAKDFQSALDINAGKTAAFQKLEAEGKIKSFVSLNSIFPDKETAAKRAEAWRRMQNSRSNEIIELLKESGKEQGFKEETFYHFYELLKSEPESEPVYPEDILQNNLFANFILQDDAGVDLINMINVSVEMVPGVVAELENSGIDVIDKTSMAAGLVSVVKDNFNFILLVTSLLVFFTLLLNYGRIELALITFLPMVVSWVWILGICGLFDIRFNFINVLITTFIFGLGDDFCIFVSDGLLGKFKEGRNKLSSYRSAIILSTATTIIGTGALIFAKHPALYSIALLSMIGMVCIAFVSFTVQPVLFHFLALKRKEKGLAPVTFVGLFLTAFAFAYFLFGCVLLHLLMLLLYPIPTSSKKKKRIFNMVLSRFCASLIYIMANVRKRVINVSGDDFKHPAIWAANHQSFIDIPALLMLHDKLLIVTNSWVWNSPFFGRIVRYAGFIFAEEDMEQNLDYIRRKVEEGYSVAIFPEGTRSVDGSIKRFHKGAFYLAETLNLPIIPVVLHGFNHTMRKNDFVLHNGTLSIKILPRIAPDHAGYSRSYSERSKEVCALMRRELEIIREETENTSYFRKDVISNYIYKGPVLEWYVRIKLRLENNFEIFNREVPKEGKIYDLGCGYGYLSYMLHFTSRNREITAFDYDTEKIVVAQNAYSQNPKLHFSQLNLKNFEPEKAKCFIIKDVLHYLPFNEQLILLEKCAQNMEEGGKLVIRDGIEEFQNHDKTKFTELLSTKLFKFNKTENELQFISVNTLKMISEKYGLALYQADKNSESSNHVFVLTRLPA